MSKNIKSIKLNSKNLLTTRKSIDDKINKYRKIIKTENVMPIKAVKSSVGSGFDLKELYNTVSQLIELRIKIKGALQYLNMGINEINYEKFKTSHYYSIFKAGEEKEKLVFLNMLKETCINPTIKSKKGAKGTGKREIFTSAKIASMIKSTQLEINKYDAKIAEFNENAEIMFNGIDDELKTLLAA